MKRLDTEARNLGNRVPNEKGTEYTVCECGNSWFEEIKVSRVSKLHMVIPGQEVPKVGSGPFILERCVKCNEIYEPNLTAATTAHVKVYNELMAELRGDEDSTEDSPPLHPSASAKDKEEVQKQEQNKKKTTKKKASKKPASGNKSSSKTEKTEEQQAAQ